MNTVDNDTGVYTFPEKEAGYDDWAGRKIGYALKRKAAGKAVYKPLDEIAQKYNIDAC